jgi:AraC-like DNA-binding protein
MEQREREKLNQIFPVLLYTVDRAATPVWKLDDTRKNHNLTLIYGGRAEFTCGGVTKEATAGDLIYFKPGDHRKARTFADAPIQCFAVDFTYLCPLYQNDKWELAAPPLPLSFYQRLNDDYLYDRLMDLFGLLTKTILSNLNQSPNKARAIFTEILTLLFQFVERNSYSYSSIRKVEALIGYMGERYQENISLAQLAHRAGISESYLGRIFKSVTGKTPIDYLIDIRISKAKNLLLDGFTVTETSRLVGFNDIYYFSRAFKKSEGISPTAFLTI